jgi:putative Mg2+ transporter-C (MgtC) family protein
MDIQYLYQLFLSVILGALIGLERECKKREAGLQTYTLVTLGTCLFTIIAIDIIGGFTKTLSVVFDPLRIIQAVAIGIGFIGAGVIFRQSSGIVGLTTAAGLWVASAIGIAIGMRFYSLAIFTAFLTLLVLSAFGEVEKKVFKKD